MIHLRAPLGVLALPTLLQNWSLLLLAAAGERDLRPTCFAMVSGEAFYPIRWALLGRTEVAFRAESLTNGG